MNSVLKENNVKIFQMKTQKGSVLVFSLIILSVMLSSALTITAVTVSNRKSVSLTARSAQAYQVADSGVEILFKHLYKNSYATPSAFNTALSGSCNSTSGETTFTVPRGTVKARMISVNGAIISCADTTTIAWRNDLAKIKVEGWIFDGTTRLIETAIKSP